MFTKVTNEQFQLVSATMWSKVIPFWLLLSSLLGDDLNDSDYEVEDFNRFFLSSFVFPNLSFIFVNGRYVVYASFARFQILN